MSLSLDINPIKEYCGICKEVVLDENYDLQIIIKVMRRIKVRYNLIDYTRYRFVCNNCYESFLDWIESKLQ
jgi:hypothetical protein